MKNSANNGNIENSVSSGDMKNIISSDDMNNSVSSGDTKNGKVCEEENGNLQNLLLVVFDQTSSVDIVLNIFDSPPGLEPSGTTDREALSIFRKQYFVGVIARVLFCPFTDATADGIEFILALPSFGKMFGKKSAFVRCGCLRSASFQNSWHLSTSLEGHKLLGIKRGGGLKISHECPAHSGHTEFRLLISGKSGRVPLLFCCCWKRKLSQVKMLLRVLFVLFLSEYIVFLFCVGVDGRLNYGFVLPQSGIGD
ncbi:hypothetical protein CEXT_258031 [Caerostris extrusa]|uniref:Uncharacterized protein n=1 Tax=Caerostris extrusa TaxID=172846 RepID=A0AAV4NKL0_CAEEX|nr:hypothetical protein CEXT_258031 [Caerostris extrusa]